MKKHAHLSGGGTRGIGLLAQLEALQLKGITFDIFSCVSVGSVIVIPFLMGKTQKVKEIFFNMTSTTFFKVPPFNKKGKVGLINFWRIIRGKALGDQSNLEKLLRKHITKEEFEEFKKTTSVKKIYIGWTDLVEGVKYKDILTADYEEMIGCIMASASIPFFTEPINLSHNSLNYSVDCGVTNHSLCFLINKKEASAGDISVSMFTRPKERFFDPLKINKISFSRQFKILMRVNEIRDYVISKKDERANDAFCEENGVINYVSYLDDIMDGPYDFDKSKIHRLYDQGKANGKYFGDLILMRER